MKNPITKVPITDSTAADKATGAVATIGGELRRNTIQRNRPRGSHFDSSTSMPQGGGQRKTNAQGGKTY